ncbi:MAG: DUF1489 family protein [Hyphomicrobiales bacterium]
MTVHILKLCVGVDTIEELSSWQKMRLKNNARVFHVTRMMPRRKKEVLDGGSLYWVIKGTIQVRQRIIGLEPVVDEDGINRTEIQFDPELVSVRPAPRRAFQGWRYLEAADAPPDLTKADLKSDIPPEMRAELIELGLI